MNDCCPVTENGCFIVGGDVLVMVCGGGVVLVVVAVTCKIDIFSVNSGFFDTS